MGIILALASSVLWGIADFSGGSASRRLPSTLVVLISQAVGLAAALITAISLGVVTSSPGYIPWAIAAGIAGVTGLLAFYRALATGTMGVVSPIAALGVVVPVFVGFVTGHWPSAIVGIGIVLAIAGVVAASGPERGAGRSLRPVMLAVVAAVCFGATLLFIAGGADTSPVMTMAMMRVTSVLPLTGYTLIMRAARRRTARYDVIPDDSTPIAAGDSRPASPGVWALVAVAGLFDMSANLTFAYASTAGALAIVAILGSLYPAVTVLLARVWHSERLAPVQQAGVVLALAGVALIAGWS